MDIIKEIRLTRTEVRTTSSKVLLENGEYEWQDTKESFEIAAVGVIRTRTYAKSFAHISELAAIAKQDFPQLADKDLRVTHYAGDYYAGTYGIEFDLPTMTEAPEGYRPINNLEYTK